MLSDVNPVDEMEADHLSFAKEWVLSGKELYRKIKPDIPDIHLVSYCVVIDFDKDKILLGSHKTSGLWLPPGGHCDYNEIPLETAKRELEEEVGLIADFYSSKPIFISVTKTNEMGNNRHTDVAFWYVSHGDSLLTTYYFDESEFFALKWFSLDEVPLESTDRNMASFLKKIKIYRKVGV